MSARIFRFLILAVIFSILLSGGIHQALAQDSNLPDSSEPTKLPPLPPGRDPHDRPGYSLDDKMRQRELETLQIGPLADNPLTPLATGGPDDYGYTWDDSMSSNWIDASAGTNTGLTDYCGEMATVPLGFSFKFYENTYASVYVSYSGFLVFGTDPWECDSQGYTKNPSTPNNVIAPYWAPFVNGQVRYLKGGQAPNRYLVIEWIQMISRDQDSYTFEVILHENGDILFQYQAMNYPPSGGYWCGGVGIEDSLGLDGFNYRWCSIIPSSAAVRFYRPAPAARVKIHPLYQGQFAHPGELLTYSVSIKNTGELGPDTYNLNVLTTWPVTLFAANGITPLTDTDGDFLPDTGTVDMNLSKTIMVKIQVPESASTGDAHTVSLKATSMLNNTKSKTVSLQAAVPTSFAQVYSDSVNNGAMSLDLVQPGGTYSSQATQPDIWGYNPAVAETPSGNFAYAWATSRCIDDACNLYTNEIEFTISNKYGQTLKPQTKLINNSGAVIETYDYEPVVSAAPDGRIGIVWVRELYQYTNNIWMYNRNIFLAVLDTSGSLVFGPFNMTNDNAWQTSNDPTYYYYQSSHLSATTDNHFFVSWHKYTRGNTGSLQDVYYSIYDTSGAVIKGVTNFTNDTLSSSDYYNNLNLTPLSGDRMLLVWEGSNNGLDIFYAVMDSAGAIVKDKTNLTNNGYAPYDYSPDAVQLTDGKTLIAWTGSDFNTSNIHFAVIDSSYNQIAGPIILNNPAALTGNDYVSVAADQSGRAVLSWTDESWDNRTNLYYALVNSSGGVLTQPMIFHSTLGGWLDTSYSGYGITSYSSINPESDGAVKTGSNLYGAPPGGMSQIQVNYTNYGNSIATGISLVATLGNGLVYVGDTSGVVPVINNNVITWTLHDVSFLADKKFSLFVSIPSDAAIGDRYSVSFNLTTNSVDADLANNTAQTEVMAARQVFLPVVRR